MKSAFARMSLVERIGGAMSLVEPVEEGGGLSGESATRWPYLVGLGCLSFGAIGLVIAPISAVVYVALPGLVLASLWAFACRCPARAGLAVSAGAFVVGVAALVVGFLSLANPDYFFAQEWGFMGGLFGFPLIGLLVGIPSMLVAWRRPGVRRFSPGSATRRADPVDHIGERSHRRGSLASGQTRRLGSS
jgi:hypothetical protein